MSGTEEDTELRDLVTQALDNNGLLGKIQAQLRAGVFLALEETDKKNRKVHHNKRLQHFLSTKEGVLAAGIVQEFLEFFQLDYTAAVFEPESGMTGKYEGRSALEKQVDYDVSDELPLLAAIIKQSDTGHNVRLNGGGKDNKSSPQKEDSINDTMDFFDKREPIDDLVNKYANTQVEALSPPHPYKEPPSESPPTTPPSELISEHITDESDSFHQSDQSEPILQSDKSGSLLGLHQSEGIHSNQAWDKELHTLDKRIADIAIKTPPDISNKYDDDFEKNTSIVTDEISGLSDIDDILQTSERVTDKAAEESMLTSDHTISVDSMGDIDYAEDITF